MENGIFTEVKKSEMSENGSSRKVLPKIKIITFAYRPNCSTFFVLAL
jgi:hypothetical protein